MSETMAGATELCPDEMMAELAVAAEADTGKGLRRTDVLLRTYDQDPRLHFLKGSLLAALQRYGEAVGPMRRAIEIAPGYDIARFQLGLLLLSSGQADPAIEVWAPLSQRAPDEPLRLFAEGLQHMARDDFEPAERMLRDGMARNQANPALNRDIEMVLARMRETAVPTTDELSSDAHWLLQVSASKQTKH